MRAAAALALAFVACACAPPQTADRSVCVRLFQDYDRLAQFRPPDLYDGGRQPFPLDPLARQVTLLIQNDCLTRGRDLTRLEATAEARRGRPVAERGAALARPAAVHVGTLTSDADAARAVAVFQSLGLRATSIGAPRLGRRVYVGPVTTEGGLGEVLALAFEAGFVGAYPSRFFRF